MHFPDLEKSWNLKKRPKSWKNHGISKYPHGKNFEPHVHYPKNVRAARASSNGDGKIYIVCFHFGAEGVAKRGDVEPTLKKKVK